MLQRLQTEPEFMFLKIASITLPIFTLALVGFFYSRRVKPDLAGANKLVIDIVLPVLIFISLSAKSFDPLAALSFTGASIVLIILCGLIAWPLAKFSGATQQAFAPCAMFSNVGPVGIPLIGLAYGSEGMTTAVVLLVFSAFHARCGRDERQNRLAHGLCQSFGMGDGAGRNQFTIKDCVTCMGANLLHHDW